MWVKHICLYKLYYNKEEFIVAFNKKLTLDGLKYYTTKIKNLLTTSILNHNSSDTSHADIRDLITGLTTRLNALADSDDTTLDQLSEIVSYIKSNRTLIEEVTTNKVNVSDIVNNLTTNVTNKPLSAAQGVTIKSLIDAKPQIQIITWGADD